MGMKDTLLDSLAGLSPIIGAALGGPVGGIIGKSISVAAKTISGKTEPADIIKELSMDAGKLAQLELEAQEKELEELRIHAGDRDSARDMQTELAKANHGSAWAAPLVSVVVTIGFFGMLYVVLDMADKNIPDVAFIMLGSLAAGFTQVLNYWLGSSKGSKDKDMLSYLKGGR